MNVRHLIAGFVTVVFFVPPLRADEAPKAPGLVKEHEWLQRFVGEWEVDGAIKVQETARSLGGFWIVCESKVGAGDKPMTALQTLGYDPKKKKYVGTFIASVGSELWTYEGTVDPTGKILTLEAEGPNPLVPGKLFKYRDTYEFKDRDHKLFTSSIQGADDKWETFQRLEYKRKK